MANDDNEELFFGDEDDSQGALMLGGDDADVNNNQEEKSENDLKINNEDIKEVEKAFEELKSEKFYYSYFGYKNFHNFNQNEIEDLKSKIEKLSKTGQVEWGRTEKLAELDKNLNLVKSNLLTKKKDKYDEKLKELLLSDLKEQIKPLLDDKILELSEYKYLMKLALDLNLVSKEDQSSINEIQDLINNFAKEANCQLFDIKDGFINFLNERFKEEWNYIDSKKQINEFCEEYINLKSNKHFIQTLEEKEFSVDEVKEEVLNILNEIGKPLKSRFEIFEKFHYNEWLRDFDVKEKNEYDLSAFKALLKDSHKFYDISEDELKEFLIKQGLKLKKQKIFEWKPFNFEIKKNKFEPVNDKIEMARMLEEHKNIGIEYLYRKDISAWIEQNEPGKSKPFDRLIEQYPDDKEAGRIEATYLLDSDKNYKTISGEECSNKIELGDQLEKEFHSYLDAISNPNNELYLFLEARSSEEEFEGKVELYRNYCKSVNSNERLLNTIILDFQGFNNFKIDDFVFTNPKDLAYTEKKVLIKLVELLKNPNSKLFIFLEQFKNIEGNIKKWLDLKRYNILTFSYAVEENSPFHFSNNEIATNSKEFKEILGDMLSDNEFSTEATNINSLFVEEAKFWLKNYCNEDYIKVMEAILEEYAGRYTEEIKIKIKNLLIDNYGTTFSKLKYEKKIETMEKIKSLNKEHEIALGYDNNVSIIMNNIKNQNKKISSKNLGITLKNLLAVVILISSCFVLLFIKSIINRITNYTDFSYNNLLTPLFTLVGFFGYMLAFKTRKKSLKFWMGCLGGLFGVIAGQILYDNNKWLIIPVFILIGLFGFNILGKKFITGKGGLFWFAVLGGGIGTFLCLILYNTYPNYIIISIYALIGFISFLSLCRFEYVGFKYILGIFGALIGGIIAGVLLSSININNYINIIISGVIFLFFLPIIINIIRKNNKKYLIKKVYTDEDDRIAFVYNKNVDIYKLPVKFYVSRILLIIPAVLFIIPILTIFIISMSHLGLFSNFNSSRIKYSANSEEANPNIYVTGYQYNNSDNSIKKAALWNNGKIKKLLNLNLGDSEAKSIKITDKDIYVTGFYSPNIKYLSDDYTEACYWKNGKRKKIGKINNISEIFMGIQKESQSIFIDEKNMYISYNMADAENNNYSSYLIKDKNYYQKNGLINSIYVNKEDEYLGGSLIENKLRKPGYIKNNKLVILNKLQEGAINSMTVYRNTVYSAGYFLFKGLDIGCYWIGDKRYDMTPQGGGNCNSIYVTDDGNVYVCGYYSIAKNKVNKKVACYWKNGVKYDLVKSDIKYDSEANSMFFYNNDLYIVGNINGLNKQKNGCYWKNGTKTDLINNSEKIGFVANSIYVTK